MKLKAVSASVFVVNMPDTNAGLAREAPGNWQLGDRGNSEKEAWRKMVYLNAGKALELDSANDEALANSWFVAGVDRLP